MPETPGDTVGARCRCRDPGYYARARHMTEPRSRNLWILLISMLRSLSARRKSSGGADAATPVTSGRELEALLLEKPGTDRDDLGIELDPGVLAHLGESDLHAEGGPVRAV
jgi:hypothetical protein